MGNITSFDRDNFVCSVLDKIGDKKIYDENNNEISRMELIDTINFIYLERDIKYFRELRCKPYMIYEYIPKLKYIKYEK